MSASLLKIVADFDTQLVTAASIGGTTATLVSATDDDGVALPTGTYGLTIDAGNSSKEYIICTLTSTALTGILSITRQGTTSSGFARAHRRGAKVTLTDWAILKRMLNNLDGTTGFDSAVKLGYDADPGITSGDTTKFATVKFVNDTAIAGAPDASTSTKGIVKMSTAPVSSTSPIAVGDNDGRVPTQSENDALVGNNTDIAVGTGNKFVTQTGLQHSAEVFAVDGSGSSTAYTATLSPVPTSLTNGMTVRVKIGSANTTTTPTLNVNSLGAKTIVKGVNTALAVSDISAGMYCTFIYDSTNTVWVLQNPVSTFITPITDLTNYTPNTLETTNTYYTYQVPILWTASGAISGWLIGGNMAATTPTNGYAGASGLAEIASTGSGSMLASIPGTGSTSAYSFATAKTLRIKFRMKGLATNDMGIGLVNSGADLYAAQSSVTDSARFVSIAGTIYAVTANGTTNTNTNISSGITFGDWNTYEIVALPGTSVKFYINGTLKATHTTNLPTTACNFFGFAQTGGRTMYLTTPTISLEQ